MRLVTCISFILTLAVSLTSVSAVSHVKQGRNHQGKRLSTAMSVRPAGELSKRQTFTGARFTYFADGLGACGIYSQPTDYIVALNSDQYGSGGYCFQMITITYGGQTTQAQIVDECPGCGWGELDFSQGLFEYFADTSVGEIYGTWWFDNGAPASSSAPPPPPSTTWQPPPPSTTWQPPPPPSTTWQPPPPSTTWSPPPPSTSTWTSSTSTSSSGPSSSSVPSTTATSDAAVVSVGVITTTGGSTSILNDVNLSLLCMAGLVSSSEDQTSQ
ncbi:RlpA-like double-psi beta-barrel-protein domain-containing protein-containing protein [Hygrophoropsis aurantiaca]|uniref:RlpA-like double-psi beta-barrel-protein domain-containing protein-containing protein n=1 Tax=Hygrophoropsis aurantiaca TaxID=72124 RepID=A0ACB8AGN7_9AGAM|nr:RlpA-like double-psi beta-barrel-protein domain-containing protein-containing protein [Hygrophoropsis aurantiaca]